MMTRNLRDSGRPRARTERMAASATGPPRAARTTMIAAIGIWMVLGGGIMGGAATAETPEALQSPSFDTGEREYFDPTYPGWATVLAHCATPEGFSYELLAAGHMDAFERQLFELSLVTRAEFEAFSRDKQLAFLINTHNIHAVRRVARRYPVKGIENTRLFGSALRSRDIFVLDRRWSLAGLRGKILGDEFRDIRALFAINWAMRGCAPLASTPLTEATLDDLLEVQTRAFVRNERFHRLDARRPYFDASPLLKQYRGPIERDYATLWGFIEHFADAETTAAFQRRPPKFRWGKFDKKLNDWRIDED